MTKHTFFPIPYPYELLYYTICRYNRIMDESSTTTNRRLFNKAEIGLKPFFLDNYSLFSDLFIKSKEHILEEHTPYRYFAPFCRQEDVDRLKRSCFENDSMSRYIFLSQNLDYKNLRYCPVCAKMEQEVYREPYISAFHCLPNVPFCIYHGCLLIPIAPEKYQWRLEYLTISHIQNEGYRPVELIPIINRISPLIEDLFSDPFKPFEYKIEDIPGRMYSLLQQNGYIYEKGECLNYIKLRKDLFEKYNLRTSVLKIMDLTEDDIKSISCVISRTVKNRLSPILYFLVIGLFCTSMKDFYETEPYNFRKKKIVSNNHKILDEEEKQRKIEERNKMKDARLYNEILLSYERINNSYEVRPMITKQILLAHTDHFKGGFYMDQLPKSKALIDSLIDNPDDYKYEKIRAAALVLINEGRKVSVQNLRKIAGLRLSENMIKKLWPRVLEECGEFTNDGYRKRS